MTTVLVFGTFDILHPGHLWFLRKAGKLGDRVVAVVSRDNYVKEWKGHPPLSDEQSRISALLDSGLVDQAILADEEIRTYGVINEIRPDIICLGHDQKALKDDLNNWLGSLAGGAFRIQIHVLAPWKRDLYSSTRRNKVIRGAGGKDSPALTWVLSISMVAAMMLFGFSWVSGKRISGMAGPGTLAFIRFVLTGALFLPLFLGRGPTRMSSTQRRKGWAWTGVAALMISSYNVCFFLGLDAGLAGKGGLIVTTLNPLFTFLILLLFNSGRPPRIAVLGITIGIIGGVLLFQPWKFSFSDLYDSGNLAFLGAALSWSGLTILSRKAQEYVGFRRFNLGLYAIASLCMLPLALAETGGTLPTGLNWAFWRDMIYISAAVGALGTGIYFIVSSKLGPSRGSSYTYLVPVSAVLFSALVLGEKPEMTMLAGASLAIIAVLMINRR